MSSIDNLEFVELDITDRPLSTEGTEENIVPAEQRLWSFLWPTEQRYNEGTQWLEGLYAKRAEYQLPPRNPVFLPWELMNPRGPFFAGLTTKQKLWALLTAFYGFPNPIGCTACAKMSAEQSADASHINVVPFYCCTSLVNVSDGICANCQWNNTECSYFQRQEQRSVGPVGEDQGIAFGRPYSSAPPVQSSLTSSDTRLYAVELSVEGVPMVSSYSDVFATSSCDED